MTAPPLYVSITGGARLLGVTPGAVRARIRRGAVPVRGTGPNGAKLVLLTDLIRDDCASGLTLRLGLDDRERFTRYVHVAGDAPEACWLWMGANGKDGRGRFSIAGRTHPAARAAYLLFIGPADGLEVHHLCSTPGCVRPSHLVALSRMDHRLLHASLRREKAA